MGAIIPSHRLSYCWLSLLKKEGCGFGNVRGEARKNKKKAKGPINPPFPMDGGMIDISIVDDGDDDNVGTL